MRGFRTRVAQKFSSRRERLDLIPHRQNQTLGGPAERRIVVDDDYDGIGIVHASPLPSAGKAISVVDDVRRSLDHFALKPIRIHDKVASLGHILKQFFCMQSSA